jgi:transcriptional regulator with XRE-family HTH domain
MSGSMSHIATMASPPARPPCHYSGRAFLVSQFYTRPMALRIRHLRESKGWTQADLAEKAGMSRSQLAMIEAETRPANTLRLNSIAAALGVVPEALFDSGDESWRLAEIVRALTPPDRAILVQMAEALASKLHKD